MYWHKIILSEIPDNVTKTNYLYYVEFKVKRLLRNNGSADGQEIMPRQNCEQYEAIF